MTHGEARFTLPILYHRDDCFAAFFSCDGEAARVEGGRLQGGASFVHAAPGTDGYVVLRARDRKCLTGNAELGRCLHEHLVRGEQRQGGVTGHGEVQGVERPQGGAKASEPFAREVEVSDAGREATIVSVGDMLSEGREDPIGGRSIQLGGALLASDGRGELDLHQGTDHHVFGPQKSPLRHRAERLRAIVGNERRGVDVWCPRCAPSDVNGAPPMFTLQVYTPVLLGSGSCASSLGAVRTYTANVNGATVKVDLSPYAAAAANVALRYYYDDGNYDGSESAWYLGSVEVEAY